MAINSLMGRRWGFIAAAVAMVQISVCAQLATSFFPGAVANAMGDGTLSNDACGGAIVITDVEYTNTQSTIGATSDNDPASPDMLKNGVWYAFTAPTNGSLFVETLGSDFDTAVAVYTGSCDSLELLTFDDDVYRNGSHDITSAVNVSAIAGVTYYFLAGGYDGETGRLAFHLSFNTEPLSIPPNDRCVDAIVITGVDYTNTQSTAGATVTGDPPQPGSQIGGGVWYSYTAPEDGLVVVDASGSGEAAALAVFSGQCDSLTMHPGASNGVSSEYVLAGTTLVYETGGVRGAPGDVTIHLAFRPQNTLVANDWCSGAIVVDTPRYDGTQSTVNATSLGDPGDAGSLMNGVWYRFTPTENGTLALDTGGSDFDTVMGVYTGNCDSLTLLTFNDDGGTGGISSIQSLPVTASMDYYILIGGFEGLMGTLNFHLRFQSAGGVPLNDRCADATVIHAAGYSNTQSTSLATSDGDPALPSGVSASNGVWYVYTAPADGTLVVDTVGSDFDTVLAVYTGSPDSLSLLTYNDDTPGDLTSQVTIGTSAGTTYYCMACGHGGATGNLVFNLNFSDWMVTTPANDRCDNPSVINDVDYSVVQSTIGATLIGDPEFPSAPVNGVWYQFTAPDNGTVTVSTDGSDFRTRLAAFTGACGALELRNHSTGGDNFEGATLTQNVTKGETWYFEAGGLDGMVGYLAFLLSFQIDTTPPLNDRCSGAIVASQTLYSNAQSTGNATSDGDPGLSSGILSNGVWYTFTAPSNGSITADTIGSDFDTVLAVYTGSCDALSLMAFSDDATNAQSSVTIAASAGTTYYFLAGGYDSATGGLVFNLAFDNSVFHPPANDLCLGAVAMTGNSYTNQQTTIGATVTGDPDTASSLGNGVWYVYTPPADGIVVIDTLGSDFRTVVAQGVGECGHFNLASVDDGIGLPGTAVLTNTVVGGTTYYYLIGGVSGAVGNLTVHLAFSAFEVGPPPRIDTTNDFGLQLDQIGFYIAANPGQSLVIEFCTNLLNAQWIPLQTNTAGLAPVQFVDPNSASEQQRYYRVRATRAVVQ